MTVDPFLHLFRWVLNDELLDDSYVTCWFNVRSRQQFEAAIKAEMFEDFSGNAFIWDTRIYLGTWPPLP